MGVTCHRHLFASTITLYNHVTPTEKERKMKIPYSIADSPESSTVSFTIGPM